MSEDEIRHQGTMVAYYIQQMREYADYYEGIAPTGIPTLPPEDFRELVARSSDAIYALCSAFETFMGQAAEALAHQERLIAAVEPILEELRAGGEGQSPGESAR